MSGNPIELSGSDRYDGRSTSSPSSRHTSATRLRRKITRENIEAAQRKLSQLIESDNESIALESTKWVLEQAIGRAPLRNAESNKNKANVDNRLQIAIQSLIL